MTTCSDAQQQGMTPLLWQQLDAKVSHVSMSGTALPFLCLVTDLGAHAPFPQYCPLHAALQVAGCRPHLYSPPMSSGRHVAACYVLLVAVMYLRLINKCLLHYTTSHHSAACVKSVHLIRPENG